VPATDDNARTTPHREKTPYPIYRDDEPAAEINQKQDMDDQAQPAKHRHSSICRRHYKSSTDDERGKSDARVIKTPAVTRLPLRVQSEPADPLRKFSNLYTRRY
jgi:hypothetical protein